MDLYYNNITDENKEEFKKEKFEDIIGMMGNLMNECIVSSDGDIVLVQEAFQDILEDNDDKFFLKYNEWTFAIDAHFMENEEGNENIYKITKITDFSCTRAPKGKMSAELTGARRGE